MKRMNGNRIILMGDVIKSSQQNQVLLMEDFKEIIAIVNKNYKNDLLSPLTITLGDEFQGVVKDVFAATQIIIAIEERIIVASKQLSIRYVCYEGKIDTPINPTIAYEMLGEGLTNARKAIEQLKRSKSRFFFNLKNTFLSEHFNDGFFIFENILKHWRKEDLPIVAMYFMNLDYKAIAIELDKNRDQIWKREKSLRIKEYFSIKKLLLNLQNLLVINE